MNTKKYGDDITTWPDYMLQTQINGQNSNENNDATLIALVSVILGMATFILSASFIRFIIIIAFILLSIQFVLSYINIYIRFHPKYQVGDSYMSRKFFTAAVPYFLYSIIIPYIIVDKGLLWIALFFLPYIFSSPLINGLWRQFDSLSYAKIDSKLADQRRSYFETAEQAQLNYRCRQELALREANRYHSDSRDLEDIEIFRKDDTSGT